MIAKLRHANPFKKEEIRAAFVNDTSRPSPASRRLTSGSKQNSSKFRFPDFRSPLKVLFPARIRRTSAERTAKSVTNSGEGSDKPVAGKPSSSADNDISACDANRKDLDQVERQTNDCQSIQLRQRLSSELVPTEVIRIPRNNGSPTPILLDGPLATPNVVTRGLAGLSQEDVASNCVTGSGPVIVQQEDTKENVGSAIKFGKSRRRPCASGPILCALGCGTMGRSILSGVLESLEESGTADYTTGPDEWLSRPRRFIACVRTEDTATKLKLEWGDMVTVVSGPQDNASAVHRSDYILLGSKPAAAEAILNSPGMQEALRGKVLISILAGKMIQSLQSMCPETKIIRVMPNTPARIRKGMSVIVPGEGVSDSDLEVVSWIFGRVGKTLVMNETHIDAANAMCGSGPAFMAIILESITDGGVAMGIPRAQAEVLAAQTMLGTACLAQAGHSPFQIRNDVATPGGCTINGVLEMEVGKIRGTMARTIQTTTKFAAALGESREQTFCDRGRI